MFHSLLESLSFLSWKIKFKIYNKIFIMQILRNIHLLLTVFLKLELKKKKNQKFLILT